MEIIYSILISLGTIFIVLQNIFNEKRNNEDLLTLSLVFGILGFAFHFIAFCIITAYCWRISMQFFFSFFTSLTLGYILFSYEIDSIMDRIWWLEANEDYAKSDFDAANRKTYSNYKA